MARIECLFRCLTAASLALMAAGAGADTRVEDLHFRVLLDDREIGHHSFRIAGEGDRETVEIDADFDVTFFAIPVYSYDHRNREVWNDGCLQEIASFTDDNGDEYQVEGGVDGGVFRLSTGRQRLELEVDCVMTFAYWNRDFLEQSRLLNAQTGDYLPVRIDAEGAETVNLDGERVEARRYRIRNAEEEIDISVWYERDSGKWLSLESRVGGDRVIRYLPARPQVAARNAAAGAATRYER